MTESQPHSSDISAGCSFPGDQTWSPSVFQFVYSKAVAKAFRQQYQCNDFGQPSAKQPSAVSQTRPLTAHIRGLPEIYSEYMVTRERLERKRNYIARMKRERADSKVQKGIRLPRQKSSMRRADKASTRVRRRIQPLKLPPISQNDLDSGDRQTTP